MIVTLIVLFIVLGIIRHQVYEEQTQAEEQMQDDKIDYYLVGVLIEKNKYLGEKNPKNYKINMKLGLLYQIEKDYKNSELEYKKAINKAPYMEFSPEYKLANLYIHRGRLDEAQDLMDGLEEMPDKYLIEYKADIYNKLGDAYYNRADYENAALKYQKSLFYYEVIKSKQIQFVKNSLASSYVYLAEAKVNNMQIDEAISSLNTALTIIDAPIIKYKLALLLMKDNPNLAYTYFEEVFKETPEIINYEGYNKFLSNMAADAMAQGNVAQSELYQYKMKQLNSYFKSNILSIEDIKIDDIKGRFVPNKWTGKDDIYLEFKLKNVSKYDIKSLYLEVNFKDKDLTIENYSKQIVDKNSILKVGANSPTIAIKVSKIVLKKDNQPNKITAEIYLSKTDQSCKLLLSTFEIKDKIKQKHTSGFIIKNYKKFIKKFPAFLF